MKVWIYKGDKVPETALRLLLTCWQCLDMKSKITELETMFPSKGIQIKGSLFVVGGGSVIIDQETVGKNRNTTHDRFYTVPL